jgi:hypothetical protein
MALLSKERAEKKKALLEDGFKSLFAISYG